MFRSPRVFRAVICGLAVAGCTPAPVLRPSPCDVQPVADAACTVVAYGMLPKRTNTSAIASYVVRDADRSGVGRIEDLIDGRFPGVTVDRLANGDYSIHIRGSIGGTNGGEPIIVVDGIAPPPGMSSRIVLGSIAPGAVARIDVLRDAGATSAYGSRAAHGVILITTRR